MVSKDQSEALFTITQVTTSAFHPMGRVHFPGLKPDAHYRLTALVDGAAEGPGQSPLPWLQDPVVMSGEALGTIGVRAPVQFPETSTIIKLQEVPATD